MKKFSLFAMALLFSLVSVFAQKQQKVTLNAQENGTFLISKSADNLVLKTSLSALYFADVQERGNDYTLLQANGLIKTFDVGNPNIPVVSKLIEIPQDAQVEINVVSYDEQIIKLSEHGISNKIIPAQRSISKSEDPIDVPFVLNEEVYSTNEYFNTEIATFEESGMMRATRFGRIQINPIQYNPAENTLRVLNNLVIEFNFVNANHAKTQELKNKYASHYFDATLDGFLINYEKTQNRDLITDPVELVIVADRMFEAQLQEFIEWKELKGFNVTTLYTDEIGSSTTAIKSELQSIYEGANPMDFVLFVGDTPQIPAWDGSSGSHVTDLRYCEYTGDDVAEVFYGRFSAQNTAQLQPQIDKTLMYEKYEMSDPTYLEDHVLVAGVDAGYATVFGNGAINYISDNYANAENNINPLTYLYQDAGNSTVMNSDASGAPASIFSYMNQGVGWANYTAHCDWNGWADPAFQLGEVANLTNNEKYGLWIGNCCLSNKFDESECFGEAALRKADAGAIGDIGGSNSTYWDEDYYWATGVGNPVENPSYDDFDLGSYDAVYHTLANEVNDPSQWFIMQAQVNTCGQLAVEASSSTRKQYYWEIYHLMGDPTVMNYLYVPAPTTYSFAPTLMVGATTADISTAPYATVAMHQDGNRITVAMTDANGDATLNFSPALSGSEVTLVITAQNHQPVITTLQPLVASEPYVLVSDYSPTSGDFGTTFSIDASFENVANAGYDAAGVTATITTSDTYATIVNGTATVGTVNGGQTVDITDAFEISFSNDVPDQHEATFEVEITGSDAKYTWNSTMKITANAPILEVAFGDINDNAGEIMFTSSPVVQVNPSTNYNYDVTVGSATGNNNGLLDAGETAGITVNTANNGHADLENATCTLTSTSPYVTVNSGVVSIDLIAVGQTLPAVFNISIDESTPAGTVVELIFTITSGSLEEEIVINLPVGLQIEDFETGDFTNFAWETPVNMEIQSTEVYEGTYAAHSTTAGQADSEAYFEIITNVASAGTISFYKKVSCEDSGDYEWDFLEFLIDGTRVGKWSGEDDWSLEEFDVTSGSHTFTWKYVKDGSVNDGDDCAWVDYITFPGISTAKGYRNTSITATTLPTWLTLNDNGDGTANLSGTSPAENGTHPVVLLADDGSQTVEQEFSITVGAVSINSIYSEFEIYPNPTTGILNIEMPFENEEVEISVLDITGKIVSTQKANSSNTKVDLSNSQAGVYMLQIQTETETYTEKIILK